MSNLSVVTANIKDFQMCVTNILVNYGLKCDPITINDFLNQNITAEVKFNTGIPAYLNVTSANQTVHIFQESLNCEGYSRINQIKQALIDKCSVTDASGTFTSANFFGNIFSTAFTLNFSNILKDFSSAASQKSSYALSEFNGFIENCRLEVPKMVTIDNVKKYWIIPAVFGIGVVAVAVGSYFAQRDNNIAYGGGDDHGHGGGGDNPGPGGGGDNQAPGGNSGPDGRGGDNPGHVGGDDHGPGGNGGGNNQGLNDLWEQPRDLLRHDRRPPAENDQGQGRVVQNSYQMTINSREGEDQRTFLSPNTRNQFSLHLERMRQIIDRGGNQQPSLLIIPNSRHSHSSDFNQEQQHISSQYMNASSSCSIFLRPTLGQDNTIRQSRSVIIPNSRHSHNSDFNQEQKHTSSQHMSASSSRNAGLTGPNTISDDGVGTFIEEIIQQRTERVGNFNLALDDRLGNNRFHLNEIEEIYKDIGQFLQQEMNLVNQQVGQFERDHSLNQNQGDMLAQEIATNHEELNEYFQTRIGNIAETNFGQSSSSSSSSAAATNFHDPMEEDNQPESDYSGDNNPKTPGKRGKARDSIHPEKNTVPAKLRSELKRKRDEDDESNEDREDDLERMISEDQSSPFQLENNQIKGKTKKVKKAKKTHFEDEPNNNSNPDDDDYGPNGNGGLTSKSNGNTNKVSSIPISTRSKTSSNQDKNKPTSSNNKGGRKRSDFSEDDEVDIVFSDNTSLSKALYKFVVDCIKIVPILSDSGIETILHSPSDPLENYVSKYNAPGENYHHEIF